MTQPKYKVGDEVWTMILNKATKVSVTARRYEEVCTALDIRETLRYTIHESESGTIFETFEQVLYPTKQSLINSL